MKKKLHFYLHNNAKWLRYLLLVPVVFLGIYFFTNRFLAYPLQFTQQQNVLREPPVFHLNESVDVEAVFINPSKANVSFAAAVHWVLVTPIESGSLTDANTDVILLGLEEVVKPGCTKIEFINLAPAKVVSITKELFAAGHNKVTWRLTGHNVITSPDGRGSMVFNVDEFSFVPDDVDLPPHTIVHDDAITCAER